MHDGEFEWFQAYDHFLRGGFAWVGVSAQAAGVNALREWSPVRYATLDVTRGGTIQVDALSYDIFSQAALAARGKGTRDIMTKEAAAGIDKQTKEMGLDPKKGMEILKAMAYRRRSQAGLRVADTTLVTASAKRGHTVSS